MKRKIEKIMQKVRQHEMSVIEGAQAVLNLSNVVLSEERTELVCDRCNGIGYTQNEKTGETKRCNTCNFV